MCCILYDPYRYAINPAFVQFILSQMQGNHIDKNKIENEKFDTYCYIL